MENNVNKNWRAKGDTAEAVEADVDQAQDESQGGFFDTLANFF